MSRQFPLRRNYAMPAVSRHLESPRTFGEICKNHGLTIPVTRHESPGKVEYSIAVSTSDVRKMDLKSYCTRTSRTEELSSEAHEVYAAFKDLYTRMGDVIDKIENSQAGVAVPQWFGESMEKASAKEREIPANAGKPVNISVPVSGAVKPEAAARAIIVVMASIACLFTLFVVWKFIVANTKPVHTDVLPEVVTKPRP